MANERGHANAKARSVQERDERRGKRTLLVREGTLSMRPDKRERAAQRERIRAANAERERMLPVSVKGRKREGTLHLLCTLAYIA